MALVDKYLSVHKGVKHDSNLTLTEAHLTDQTNPHKVSAEQSNAVPLSTKGQPYGVPPLDASGMIPMAYLPGNFSGVVIGYYYGNRFYEDFAHTILIPADPTKYYIDRAARNGYFYNAPTNQYYMIYGVPGGTIPRPANTKEVEVEAPLLESLSGLSVDQQGVNIENKDAIEELQSEIISKKAIIEYEQGTEYKAGAFVYIMGLYDITSMALIVTDFTSDDTQPTVLQSFNKDVTDGNLSLVGIPNEWNEF